MTCDCWVAERNAFCLFSESVAYTKGPLMRQGCRSGDAAINSSSDGARTRSGDKGEAGIWQ